MFWPAPEDFSFDFSTDSSYQLNDDKMPDNDGLISQFDRFGFLDVFDRLDSYRLISNANIVDMKSDYFLQYTSVGFMSYDSDNCYFKISMGED